MVHMQSPPFRKAVQTDPYFKRLASSVKQHFWKIFKNISYTPEFREIIEKMLAKYPSNRHSFELVKVSPFFNQESMTADQFLIEIKQRFKKVEEARELNLDSPNHESKSMYYSEVDNDEDFLIRDSEEFQETREKYICQIEDISKMLKHQRNMKKIKKECFKNMIAGPCLVDPSLKVHKQSHSYQ